MRRLLCLIGWHRWRPCPSGPVHRLCRDCDREQVLQFYSNRTQEWIDLDPPVKEPR